MDEYTADRGEIMVCITTEFKTLKAAKEAGYREHRTDEYGGEQIQIKGQVLAKNPKRAMSKTEWGEQGFRPKAGVEPHGMLHSHSHGRHIKYPVYREDQVEPKRRATRKPALEIPIIAAVWVVNRCAKRCRDAAQCAYNEGRHNGATGAATFSKRKSDMYSLKSRALHFLVAAGKLTVVGYHRFGDNWAEVLSGEGYTFHRPCPPPVESVSVKELQDIEAKPRGASEPRLKDALHTLTTYLADKPAVKAYEWPERLRPTDGERSDRQSYSWRDGEDEDDWDDDDHP
jgi:hypothetical protein